MTGDFTVFDVGLLVCGFALLLAALFLFVQRFDQLRNERRDAWNRNHMARRRW